MLMTCQIEKNTTDDVFNLSKWKVFLSNLFAVDLKKIRTWS